MCDVLYVLNGRSVGWMKLVVSSLNQQIGESTG